MQPPWIDLALQQDHVLGRRQAMELGMSEDLWQWKLDRGIWRRTLPGVVTIHSGEPTLRQLLRTSVIKAGRGAVLAGDAVLLENGFPFKDIGVVDVAVARTAPKAFALRDGLLAGTLPREALVRLAQLVRTRGAEIDDPRLKDVLDEIELRAEVELAKLDSQTGDR